MMIGLVDKVESKKQLKSLERADKKEKAAEKKMSEEKRVKSEQSKLVKDFENNMALVEEKEGCKDDDDDDEEFQTVATERLVKKTQQNLQHGQSVLEL